MVIPGGGQGAHDTHKAFAAAWLDLVKSALLYCSELAYNVGHGP